VDRSVLWRRLATGLGAVVLSAAALGACGSSSSSTASSGSSSPSTTAAPTGCTQLATRTFVEIKTVTAGSGGALSIAGNPATLVCGGADTSHYAVNASRTVTGKVLAGAQVQVFPVAVLALTTMPHGRFASYLSTDTGSRTFLVSGPLEAITGLQEQYHP
jgi:hypothetical protein